MVVDVWKPNFGKIDNKKCVMSYGLADTDQFLTEKKTGWKVRYTCDVCCDGKINVTTSHVFLNSKVIYNTLKNQTCRSCRSRFSEYDIKKTYIPFELIIKSFLDVNYQILTNKNEYMLSKNRSQFKHNVICNNGHQITATWNNWSRGKRCGICNEQNKFDNSVKHKDGWVQYNYLVRYYTEKNYKKYKGIINPNNFRRSKEHHLDHKYSVSEGFKNGVLPKIISNFFNLEILSSYDNLRKNKKCSITLDELYYNTGYL